MATHHLIATLAVAGLGLAACSNNGHGGVAGVCKPFTTAANANANGQTAATSLNAPGAVAAPAAAPAGDPAATLDDCLHRWSYTLAASSDPANLVAEASLAACSEALSAWNQSALTTGNAGGAVQAPSLLTGQPTNPILEHHGFAQGRALFYVVQARAGHCAPPSAAAASKP